jgi:hypothetical protein
MRNTSPASAPDESDLVATMIDKLPKPEPDTNDNLGFLMLGPLAAHVVAQARERAGSERCDDETYDLSQVKFV